VVLVGDPAQIGVIRGPGGMLAALANAGHGIELDAVHRFTHDWEATASLGLRRGNPDVLAEYRDQGRLHARTDTADAVAVVHAHWAAESAAGREVLMMARTRADVEALNLAARATAVATGEVHGPVVRFGERDWQAGDLLRARRNDRRLTVGEEAHVRNGDRYRITAVHPTGVHVEHLERGEPAFLPADYVSVHGEYGWATTITAAQGATVDIGLVLVRPGIDREHLYVAMTRGREANHAYITPDPTVTDDHHGLPGVGRRDASPDERALDTLVTALARTGAQDAAHTARDNARTRTVEAAKRAAEQAARRAAEPQVPAEHAARAGQLTQHQSDRDRLARDQQEHRHAAAEARAELARTSRLRPSRRRDLTEAVARHDHALNAAFPETVRLDREITALARQVAADTRARELEQRARATRPTRLPDDGQSSYLAPAHSVELRSGPVRVRRAPAQSAALGDLVVAERSRRLADDRARERNRDDAPSIGW
jgi:ATP-dependent exoDNAse (exonuclease V) alpha subunit